MNTGGLILAIIVIIFFALFDKIIDFLFSYRMPPPGKKTDYRAMTKDAAKKGKGYVKMKSLHGGYDIDE